MSPSTWRKPVAKGDRSAALSAATLTVNLGRIPDYDSPISPPPLDSILDFALAAARQAGDLTLKQFRTDVAVDRKLDRTPVTVADRGAEELLRGLFRRQQRATYCPNSL